MNEQERLKIYMKNEVKMEKECDIEHEVGCGVVDIPTAEHFWALMSLVSEGFTKTDVNASEIDNNLTGYIWVC